ncbi:hypothetical protein H8356DRAFT_1336538 [Neocallimastix lanati (nom. inval.)]|nr:hypothetical protein H8356DRAFT_1336538 [Neocallimastix sp. JGI-2020a]
MYCGKTWGCQCLSKDVYSSKNGNEPPYFEDSTRYLKSIVKQLLIVNTNDKLNILNFNNSLIDHILFIPYIQPYVNKMNISILISTQNINNLSLKPVISGLFLASYPFVNSKLYGGLHCSRKFLQWLFEATKTFIIRINHIARFLEKKYD